MSDDDDASLQLSGSKRRRCLLEEDDDDDGDSEDFPLEEWKEVMSLLVIVGIETIAKLLNHRNMRRFIDWENEHDQTMLYRAIFCRRLDIANLLLDHDANVNIATSCGETPLLEASRTGQIDIIPRLLHKAADIQHMNMHIESAVDLAYEKGHTAIVNLLLSTLCDSETQVEWAKLLFRNELETIEIEAFTTKWLEHPNKDDFINWKNDVVAEGETMLHCALQNWRWDIAHSLLDHGADANVADRDGWTSLMHASSHGRIEIIPRLMHNGADIRLEDEEGRTALDLAFEEGHTAIGNFLLSTLCDSEIPVEWAKLLFCFNELETIEIEAFATQWMEHPQKESFINWKNDIVSGGDTMLLLSIFCRVDITELLLDHGAEINIANKYGRTALITTCSRGYTDALKLLVEKGADVNIADNCGQTALMFASFYGYNEIVKLLVEKGACVNIADKDGETPLMNAAERGHAEVAKFLIVHGANVNAQDRHGKTPMTRACEKGHLDIISLLIDNGVNLNIHVDDGMTSVHQACWKGDREVMQLLLSRGANVDIKTTKGQTLLQIATERNHLEIVWLLVSQFPRLVLEGME